MEFIMAIESTNEEFTPISILELESYKSKFERLRDDIKKEILDSHTALDSQALLDEAHTQGWLDAMLYLTKRHRLI